MDRCRSQGTDPDRPANEKSHRDHTLPLSDILVRLFRDRKQEAGDSVYVFPGKGEKDPVRDIDSARLRIVEETGIAFTIHDLRRTFATIAAEMGISAFLLKKLLNHKSGDVTEGYVISTVEILRSPLKKIAKRIEELCRIKSEEELIPEKTA